MEGGVVDGGGCLCLLEGRQDGHPVGRAVRGGVGDDAVQARTPQDVRRPGRGFWVPAKDERAGWGGGGGGGGRAPDRCDQGLPPGRPATTTTFLSFLSFLLHIHPGVFHPGQRLVQGGPRHPGRVGEAGAQRAARWRAAAHTRARGWRARATRARRPILPGVWGQGGRTEDVLADVGGCGGSGGSGAGGGRRGRLATAQPARRGIPGRAALPGRPPQLSGQGRHAPRPPARPLLCLRRAGRLVGRPQAGEHPVRVPCVTPAQQRVGLIQHHRPHPGDDGLWRPQRRARAAPYTVCIRRAQQACGRGDQQVGWRRGRRGRPGHACRCQTGEGRGRDGDHLVCQGGIGGQDEQAQAGSGGGEGGGGGVAVLTPNHLSQAGHQGGQVWERFPGPRLGCQDDVPPRQQGRRGGGGDGGGAGQAGGAQAGADGRRQAQGLKGHAGRGEEAVFGGLSGGVGVGGGARSGAVTTHAQAGDGASTGHAHHRRAQPEAPQAAAGVSERSSGSCGGHAQRRRRPSKTRHGRRRRGAVGDRRRGWGRHQGYHRLADRSVPRGRAGGRGGQAGGGSEQGGAGGTATLAAGAKEGEQRDRERTAPLSPVG